MKEDQILEQTKKMVKALVVSQLFAEILDDFKGTKFFKGSAKSHTKALSNILEKDYIKSIDILFDNDEEISNRMIEGYSSVVDALIKATPEQVTHLGELLMQDVSIDEIEVED